MNKYLTLSQLKKIGFRKIGKNCRISKSISTHNLIGTLGNNVRIDDDVQLKGKIDIKSYAHIARGCTLSGGNYGILLDEFSSLANYVQIFSSSDDYYSPSIPVGSLNDKLRKKFSKLYVKKITIGKCCLVGSLSVLLPGTNLEDFASIAALTVVNKKINRGIFFQSKSKEKQKKRNIKLFEKLYRNIKKKIE
jgi:acetyltransferase-like isoleucine patch superfamily enzyme